MSKTDATTKTEPSLTATMSELETIAEWFQQEDVDLELALNKLKRGSSLIKAAKAQLRTAENELITIKDELNEVLSETE